MRFCGVYVLRSVLQHPKKEKSLAQSFVLSSLESIMGLAGLEPAAYCLGGSRSIHLSYGAFQFDIIYQAPAQRGSQSLLPTPGERKFAFGHLNVILSEAHVGCDALITEVDDANSALARADVALGALARQSGVSVAQAALRVQAVVAGRLCASQRGYAGTRRDRFQQRGLACSVFAHQQCNGCAQVESLQAPNGGNVKRKLLW